MYLLIRKQSGLLYFAGKLDTATACDKVSGYGDFSVKAQLADENHVAMTSTFVKGSPYIYTEYGDTKSVYISSSALHQF